MVHCAIIHWPHCIILNLFHLNILLEPVSANNLKKIWLDGWKIFHNLGNVNGMLF